MTYYIVWNEAKTEGFATVDAQLAYEVRKSATSNCFDAEGNRSDAGIAFAESWTDDNCTIEQVGPDPIRIVKSLEERHADHMAIAKSVHKLRMNGAYGKMGVGRFLGCPECGQSECNGQCAGDDMMGASS